jgi:ATP-binding cassette subfamily B protein
MKRMLPFLKKYKKEFKIISITMFIVALIDVSLTYMTKLAIDGFVVKNTTEGLMTFALSYLGLTLLLSLSIFIFIEQAGRVESGLAHDVRKALFEKLQMLSISYFDKNQIGWIMARMTSDVTKLGEFVSWGLVDMVWGFTMMSGILTIMMFVNFKLALITIVVLPFLAISSVYFQKKIVYFQKEIRKLNSRVTGSINEIILGARTTKSLAIEDNIFEDFNKISTKMMKRSISSAHFASLFQPVVINIAAVGTILVIINGGNGILDKTISYGTLVLFINYSIQFFEPVRELARIMADMQSAVVSVDRVFTLLDHDIDIKDDEKVIEIFGDVLNPKKENFIKLQGEVEFKNVDFYYNEKEKVLDNLSIKIKKGQSVALVGRTGSGKSTIVSLINRFYDVTNGNLFIDEKDIKEYSISNIHSEIGYVLQTPHLFTGTIKDNIKYSDLNISDQKVIDICNTLGIHEMIMGLEKGYETEVGESGDMLSTGQRQLISFARAIIKNPSIVILDEATSSIDTHSEQLIQEAIPKLLQGRTSIIIAHRLSTIRNSDNIILIEKGKVIEEGNHNSLIKSKGRYYELYRNQYIEDNEIKILNEYKGA